MRDGGQPSQYPEMGEQPELMGDSREGFLKVLELTSFSDPQKELLRRIINSDRSCDVVRSSGERVKGYLRGIQNGRIQVSFLDETNHLRPKDCSIETFVSWQGKPEAVN